MAAVVAVMVGAGVTAAPLLADEIDEYRSGWVQRALDLQYELGSDVGMVHAQWVGTHNSFNSRAEMGPALSVMDSNQRIDLLSQLRIDVRSLELDLHRTASTDGGIGPRVCHALPNGIGCTTEKALSPTLEPIERWLRRPRNRDQVLLLYLENNLLDAATHDRAAEIIQARLGDLIFRPRGTTGADSCRELPGGLTRDRVRARGKQVVIVADCGPSAAWAGIVHTWDGRRERRPVGFEDFPSCGPDFTRKQYRTSLIRYFEDSTRLTHHTGTRDEGLTPQTTAAMARCGVNLTGLDQLAPEDGRLAASVWSWAPNKPRGGARCALIHIGPTRPWARWADIGCRALRRPVACRQGKRWLVPAGRRVKATRAGRVCRRSGAVHAVPRTGAENQRLWRAMDRRGVKVAWLGYRKSKGSWRPLDRR